MISRYKLKLEELQKKALENLKIFECLLDENAIKTGLSPSEQGRNIFEHAIKFGCILKDLDISQKFFKGALLAFEIALETGKYRQKQNGETDFDLSFRIFQVHFGYFVSKNVLSASNQHIETQHFQLALASREEVMTDLIVKKYRSASLDEYERKELSSFIVSFLGLEVIAKMLNISGDKNSIERAILLPYSKKYKKMIDSLGNLLNDGTIDDYQFKVFKSEYSRLINPSTYKLGLIGDFLPSSGYILSIIRERGNLRNGVLHLFD